MAGTIIADSVEASATSQLVIKNGIASAPPQFQDGAGTQIGTLCRAWVNFNGTGTVAIRASFNVSSITDNGTGDYTVNFTNAMPDANYSIVTSAGRGDNATETMYFGNRGTTAPTTSTVRLVSQIYTGGYVDPAYANVAVFR